MLCCLGLLLPYWQFLPWLSAHGLNLSLFARELFANRISAFFSMDALVSAIALIVFMRIENRRIRHPNAMASHTGILLGRGFTRLASVPVLA